ncbi:hypothetical protein Scep_029879 [Stephania cephalantha]|uniref:Uncharacterized protein n=1 Tax=Stephania cephalantha TaxID=152367 RepID=A0AAP0E6B2_9MAGN
MISSLKMPQHYLTACIEKPSIPGALSPPHSTTHLATSSSVNVGGVLSKSTSLSSTIFFKVAVPERFFVPCFQFEL